MKTLLKTPFIFVILSILFCQNIASAQCQYSIYLLDTYGDGWNGGAIDVYVNGSIVLSNETILSTDNGGDWKIIDFSVATSDEVTTNYTAGSWSTENEYYIYDAPGAGGNLLYSSGTGASTPGDLGTGNIFANCPTCPSPSNLVASNISSSQADLSWTENGIATLWDIEFGNEGFIPTGIPTQSSLTSLTITKTGLTPNSSYDFYIRSNCGGGDYSSWVGPVTFTTSVITGQVYVDATLGTPSATYSTVKSAFDMINNGTHQGVITVTIGANNGETIIETSEAILNKSGIGSASYTSISIMPGSTNIKVQGNISGSCCIPSGVIKLNQAENVTIDGRYGGVGNTQELTIENTNVGSYSSSLVFLAASNNVMRYSILKSSVTGTCCGAGTLSITDNNISGGSGSSNNLIEYCDITKSGSTLPSRAIYGKGASGRENSNNIIRGCNIYDFEEFGIFLGNSSSGEGFNREWVIENNEIYQTTFQTAMTKSQAGICIGYPYSSGSSGKDEEGHFVIRNNHVGGNGSGGIWQWSTNGSYYFFGIFVNDGTDAHLPTEIYNNKIDNIKITSGNTSSSSLKPIFSGIAAYNCKVNIGSKGGNVIGSLTNNSSIEFSKTGSGGYATGIFTSSPSDLSNVINNNVVAGISSIGGTAPLVVFSGIYNASATTYPTDSIYKNNVSYLSFDNTNYVNGIFGQGLISKNRVRDIDFTGAATFSELIGISWGGGEVAASDSRGVENNEVILGKNRSGLSIATNDIIGGIEIRRGDADVFYNSVLIEGIHAGSENTYAIELPNSGTVNFNNNLLYNERSGGTGKHYAAYKTGVGAGFNASNNAYVIGTGSNNILGNWSGADQMQLIDWEAVSGEVSSVSDDNVGAPVSSTFPILSYDSLDVPDPTWLQAGVPLSIPLDDIKGEPRDLVLPTIGAYEKSLAIPLSIELRTFNGKVEDNYNALYWITESESNISYFTLERSEFGEHWQKVADLNAFGNTTSQQYYQFGDEEFYPTTYYRLQEVDFNGTKSNLGVIKLVRDKNNEITIYPNPTRNGFYIENSIGKEEFTEVNIYDNLGQLIYLVQNDRSQNNLIFIDTSSWPTGLYQVTTLNGDKSFSQKLIVTE